MQRKEASAATPSGARRQGHRPVVGLVGRLSVRSGRRRQAALAVSVALVGALAATAPAQAAIEVDHGIEFVHMTDLPPNTDLLLTVTDPAGNTIGAKQFRAVPDPIAGPGNFHYEVNHIGDEEGDCFDGTTSPDIRPGDTLTVSSVADGDLQSYVTSDVRYSTVYDPGAEAIPATATEPAVPAVPPSVTMAGWARDSAGATIGPAEIRLQRGPFAAAVDVEGGNLDQNRGNRLLATPDQAADGSFTAKLTPVSEDQVSEAILEVIEGADATSFSGDAANSLPGCPALDATRGPVVVPPLPPPTPDTDGDSLLDDRDQCPNVDGPVNNDGCPVTVPPVVIDNTKPPLTNTILQQIPVAGAVAGIKAGSTAPARLSLSRLTMGRTIARGAARANGLRAAMSLQAGTKVLRVRIYRKNADGTRSLVAERFLSPAASGLYRMRLKDRRLRQVLTPGSYEAQVTPGLSRLSFGKTSKLTFRVIP